MTTEAIFGRSVSQPSRWQSHSHHFVISIPWEWVDKNYLSYISFPFRRNKNNFTFSAEFRLFSSKWHIYFYKIFPSLKFCIILSFRHSFSFLETCHLDSSRRNGRKSFMDLSKRSWWRTIIRGLTRNSCWSIRSYGTNRPNDKSEYNSRTISIVVKNASKRKVRKEWIKTSR